MTHRVAVLGSTGEIGRTVLEVLARFPDHFSVVGLSANANVEMLNQQMSTFQSTLVAIPNGRLAPLLKLPPGAHVLSGPTCLTELAQSELIDMVVVSVSGPAGILPTMRALELGKIVISSNKESLIMAGELICQTALRARNHIRPLDIEHNALWQTLIGETFVATLTPPCCIVPIGAERTFFGITDRVSKVVLTASGGPFRDLPLDELRAVKASTILGMPSWSVLSKIAVDSAGMINKALEIAETHSLFGVPYELIDALIHPEALVHCLVDFSDGNTKAGLSAMDMRIPVQFALTFPDRFAARLGAAPRGDYRALHFSPIEAERYPGYRVALGAVRMSNSCPTVLCAADEVAVRYFLEDRVRFLDIPGIIEETLSRHTAVPITSVDDVMQAYEWALRTANQVAADHAGKDTK